MRLRRTLAVVSLVVAACGGSYGEDDPTPGPTCAPACGPHGQCSGTACVCEASYTGVDCTVCAPGFVSADGACKSPCDVKSCGPHATCSVQGSDAVCACVTGYAVGVADAGDPTQCHWTGGPLDPGFQNIPPGAWTFADHASIDATIVGAVDPGVLVFDGFQGGSATQTFPMPAYVDAEPLALVVSTSCTENGKPSSQCYASNSEIGLNHRFAPQLGDDTRRVCLGERAFGGPLALSVGGASSDFEAKFGVDHVSIVPAPECPPPGTIPNPKFEDVGGWTANGPDTEIAVNAGTSGSRAGHLHLSKRCDAASLAGMISIPDTSMKSPAFRMTVRGTSNERLSIEANQTLLGISKGTGVFETQTVCLPLWSRGTSSTLRFSLSGGSGVCSDVTEKDFVIDDLEIVSDPSCGDTQTVIDGGFESKSNLSVWSVFLQADSNFEIATNSPHSGTSHAFLSGGGQCANSTFYQQATIPDPEPGKGGPQVRFWYRASGSSVTFFTPIGNLTPTSTWTEGKKCLDPKQAGHMYGVSFGLQGNGSACSYPALDIDDVDIVHSSECPE